MPTATTTYSIKFDENYSRLNAAADRGNSPNHIAIGRNRGGLLEIFFAGTDNAVYHIRQVNGKTWEGLGSFQGVGEQQVTLASNNNGILEVFCIGTDNGLYQLRCLAILRGIGLVVA